jgi:hypothetical protein
MSEKLARVCEMLSSSHEGERAAAAKIATAMLKQLDMTWTQLIVRALGAGTSVQREHQPERNRQAKESSRATRYTQRTRTGARNGVRADQWVKELEKHRDQLSEWDRQFIKTLAGFGRNITLTEAQWRLLESLAEKVGIMELRRRDHHQ